MIGLIVFIALIGFLVWLVTTLIPMDQKFKTAIVAVAVVCILLYILNFFGLWHGFNLKGP